MEQQTDFKSQDKSLRRQMIIDTAITIFHQKGYRSATLDDVAHELGLSKAALYHYVSSKEDLLSLIYIQALESYFAKAYEIDGMDLAPPDKLRLLIRNHIENIIIANLPMFAVFFTEENQLSDEAFQQIREEKRKYSRIVVGIIESGIKQGFFRPINAWLQASAIIGMCNWLYKWYKPEKSDVSPSEIANQFLDLLENGYIETEQSDATGGTVPDGSRSRKTKAARKKQILMELQRKSDEMSALLIELNQYI